MVIPSLVSSVHDHKTHVLFSSHNELISVSQTTSVFLLLLSFSLPGMLLHPLHSLFPLVHTYFPHQPPVKAP